MEKNTVIIKIYTSDNGNKVFIKDYLCKLNEKIIDIKNKILEEMFNTYNYLDFENISERVYKDYGKLFFDIGLLPSTIDNYRLSEFTIDNRIFEFIVYPKNIENKYNNKRAQNSSFLQSLILEERKKNKKPNEFQFFDNEFPPLG